MVPRPSPEERLGFMLFPSRGAGCSALDPPSGGCRARGQHSAHLPGPSPASPAERARGAGSAMAGRPRGAPQVRPLGTLLAPAAPARAHPRLPRPRAGSRARPPLRSQPGGAPRPRTAGPRGGRTSAPRPTGECDGTVLRSGGDGRGWGAD